MDNGNFDSEYPNAGRVNLLFGVFFSLLSNRGKVLAVLDTVSALNSHTELFRFLSVSDSLCT